MLLPLLLGAVVSQTAGVLAQNSTSNGTATNTTLPVSLSPTDCHCGFLDPTTNNVYTDSVIVYFNETDSIPDDVFAVDTFKHQYEKGWFLYYREGAVKENVWFQDGEVWNLSPGWLNLNVTGATPQHLVDGAQLQTVRQDIQYGTFRVFMRSPAPWAGGSALSMILQHNETSSAELALLNMDDSTNDACMQTTVANQDPELAWGMNYTLLEEPQYGNSPWDFWEWRMDWNSQNIDFYAGQNKTRTESAANASLVDTPASFYLKHWSNGDINFMQGPPVNDRVDRLDETLRLTTPHSAAATLPSIADLTKTSKSRVVGIAICCACLAFSAAILLQALVGKAVANKQSRVRSGNTQKVMTSPWPSQDELGGRGGQASGGWTTQAEYEMSDMKQHGPAASSVTLLNMNDSSAPYLGKVGRGLSSRPLLYGADSRPLLNGNDSRRESLISNAYTAPYTPGVGPTPYDTPGFDKRMSYFGGSPAISENGNERLPPPRFGASGYNTGSNSPMTSRTPAEGSTTDLLATARDAKGIVPEGSAAAAIPGARPDKVAAPAAGAVPVARTRVDYLAGLVAVCSLLVSCTHFILTFVPSVIMEYLPGHYRSESWARKTIEPFFFNEIWVGLFFTTSTRFLTSGYLRNGSLKGVAEKVVCRCPRLMIPITAVILFEYFLMDLGATKFLEYIPSITWSTWPSTQLYTNFGFFFNETLQLFYLIPNAAPQLTWNFCTGVLWTIPVQLQNSWLVLLGVVIIKEIKTPWKRFGYYAFCIINHWYAMSWGSYFWFGLMLADMDITYKYRKWVQARAYVHYPMLFLASVLVFFSLANELFSVWTGYTFSTQERGIHPEVQSGLPLAQTSSAGYPAYIEPKLNGLVFAVASQYVVELSTWVQACLSTKIFLLLFPHVFTIYLIHGLVFWSVGSLVCVYFAGIGLAYWLNMLLTALICYASLFACLPIVTPVMEMLGKEITKGIWVSASEEPAPKRPSSYPFTVEEVRQLVYRKDDEQQRR